MKKTVGILVMLGLGAGYGAGDEGARDVLVQVMRVNVSDEAVVKAVLGRTAGNDGALYRKVEGLLVSGGAALEGLSSVRVPSGERGKATAQWLSVEPTEHEVDHERRVAVPEAVETWPYGPSLEVEATASQDGRMIDVRLSVEHGAGEPVELATRVGKVRGGGAIAPNVSSRVIPLDRCSSAAMLRSGEPALISVVRRAPVLTDGGGAEETELLLTFLRGTVVANEEATGASVSIDPPRRIAVQVAAFDVERNAAAGLLWTRGGEGSDDDLFRELMGRDGDGTMRLAALNSVSAPSGQRAKVSRAGQQVFPREYEVPLMVPTAWEVRHVGQTLEVDPVLGPWGLAKLKAGDDPFASEPTGPKDSYVVDVNLAWEDVGAGEASRHGLDANEAESFIEFPTFASDRLSMAARLTDGRARLAGVVQAPGEATTRLVFLKALQLAEMPEDRPFNSGGQVLVRTLVVGVPRAAAGEIGGVAGGGKAHAILDDLLGRVAAGSAEVVAQGAVLTRSGQRAKIEGVDEVIYPTEYDEGQEEGVWYPAGFETRNVGTVFQVDPVLDPGGRTVQVHFSLECDTAPLAVAGFGAQATALASGGAAIAPDRHHLGLQQQVRLETGQVALVHVGEAKGVEGRVDYVFVVGEVR